MGAAFAVVLDHRTRTALHLAVYTRRVLGCSSRVQISDFGRKSEDLPGRLPGGATPHHNRRGAYATLQIPSCGPWRPSSDRARSVPPSACRISRVASASSRLAGSTSAWLAVPAPQSPTRAANRDPGDLGVERLSRRVLETIPLMNEGSVVGVVEIQASREALDASQEPLLMMAAHAAMIWERTAELAWDLETDPRKPTGSCA